MRVFLRPHLLLVLGLVLLIHRLAWCDEERRGLADKQAPAGLMCDHVHSPGEMDV